MYLTKNMLVTRRNFKRGSNFLSNNKIHWIINLLSSLNFLHSMMWRWTKSRHNWYNPSRSLNSRLRWRAAWCQIMTPNLVPLNRKKLTRYTEQSRLRRSRSFHRVRFSAIRRMMGLNEVLRRSNRLVRGLISLCLNSISRMEPGWAVMSDPRWVLMVRSRVSWSLSQARFVRSSKRVEVIPVRRTKRPTLRRWDSPRIRITIMRGRSREVFKGSQFLVYIEYFIL